MDHAWQSMSPGALSWWPLTTLWIARPHTAFWLRAGIGPGLLGSFTTFSALVASVDQLARGGLHGVWLAYLVLSVLLGLGAAAAGWRAGKALAGSWPP